MALCAIALATTIAIALPGTLEERRHRRITGTMVEMRTIAAAIELYAAEYGTYPSASGVRVRREVDQKRGAELWQHPPAWPVSAHQRLENVRSLLSPKYIPDLPLIDRWGHPFLYGVTEDGRSYTIVSTGPDGRLATNHSAVWYPEDTDHDFVFADGAFAERLEGT